MTAQTFAKNVFCSRLRIIKGCKYVFTHNAPPHGAQPLPSDPWWGTRTWEQGAKVMGAKVMGSKGQRGHNRAREVQGVFNNVDITITFN